MYYGGFSFLSSAVNHRPLTLIKGVYARFFAVLSMISAMFFSIIYARGRGIMALFYELYRILPKKLTAAIKMRIKLLYFSGLGCYNIHEYREISNRLLT